MWISYFFQMFNFSGSSVIYLSLREIPIWTHQRQFGLRFLAENALWLEQRAPILALILCGGGGRGREGGGLVTGWPRIKRSLQSHVRGGGQYKMYKSIIFIKLISRSEKVKPIMLTCVRSLCSSNKLFSLRYFVSVLTYNFGSAGEEALQGLSNLILFPLFATSINNTSETGGKIRNWCRWYRWCTLTCDREISKNYETVLMKVIHEKKPEAKNLVTLSL